MGNNKSGNVTIRTGTAITGSTRRYNQQQVMGPSYKGQAKVCCNACMAARHGHNGNPSHCKAAGLPGHGQVVGMGFRPNHNLVTNCNNCIQFAHNQQRQHWWALAKGTIVTTPVCQSSRWGQQWARGRLRGLHGVSPGTINGQAIPTHNNRQAMAMASIQQPTNTAPINNVQSSIPTTITHQWGQQ